MITNSSSFFTQNLNESDKDSQFVAYSLLAHLLLAGIFLLSQLIFSSDKTEPTIKMNLIKSAVRVDVVAMPKMTLKELKNIDMTSGSEIDEVTAPVKNTKVEDLSKGPEFLKKKKTKSFKDLLNQYAKRNVKATKKGKAKVKKKGKKDLSKRDRKRLRDLILAGNKVSAGVAATGDSSAVNQTVFNEYASLLPDHVRANWKLPSFLLNQELQCNIRVYISSTGKLISAEIYQSSGNLDYDNKSLTAIKSSSPYPLPPSEIRKRVSRGEIILGFPL
jgi:colicin import membrane protein